MTVSRRRVAVCLAAGLVPWILVPYEVGLGLVFSVGLVNPGPGPVAFQSVWGFVRAATRGLPPSLLAWPTATLLYLTALGSLALALVDREDRRVTAGLFALAGLDLVYFAVAFSSARLRVFAVPFGVALLWLAAWESRPASWSWLPRG
jgi:uncharacterized protein (TIGR04206 family)